MVNKAELCDLDILTTFALQLWPDHTLDEMKQDLENQIIREDSAFYLAFDGELPVGFAQCQLRYDYVEGTDSSPVGYLEGIYVAENHRGRGIARSLLSECQQWAREKGCLEFASDCELENVQSLHFHLKTGFMEANRIICFTKKL